MIHSVFIYLNDGDYNCCVAAAKTQHEILTAWKWALLLEQYVKPEGFDVYAVPY